MTKKEQMYLYLVEKSLETSPSVRELCSALSIKSTSTVYNMLHALEEDGLITLTKGKRRNISIVSRTKTVKIPLVGSVAAGLPVLAVQDIEEYVTCEVKRGSGELFSLRVRGDSMVGAGILDGDIVVVRRAATANSGEIVVALIEDEATVKRLYRNGHKTELRAENPDYEPIVADSLRLLGVVVTVLRYYE